MDEGALVKVVRPVRRGQVTLPAEFRRRLGIDDDTLLQMTLQEGKIEIVPMVATPVTDQIWAQAADTRLAPAREVGQALDEAEIDALIDQAVDEVRSQLGDR
jgi:bifunctional DNA-binding transcriptional regulator/antitoxin component of YhaV-PrlF toxin-antitoxin module